MRIPSRALLIGLILCAFAAPSRAQSTPTPPASDTGATRLFFGPTARALPAGEGYFTMHGGILPAFQVGVTDRFSIGAGTFYFQDGNFFVTPKVQIARTDSASVAATLIHFVVPGEGRLGLAFASVTYGPASGGLTVGVGAAYSDGWDENDHWGVGGPLFMIGGDRQLSPRIRFMSENYIVAGDAALLMNGCRASWAHFSLDFGAIVTVSD